MKKLQFIKFIVLFVSIFIMGMLVAGNAYCWSAATHAYIEEQLFKKQGQVDEQVMYDRIYGSNALDIFNDNFDPEYVEKSAYLHDTIKNNFLEIWEVAYSPDEKAFAYGFVGHNNTWGMDSTAHISGKTYGRSEGYVIAKANLLAAQIISNAENLGDFGILISMMPNANEVMVNICHYLVESAVDLMVIDLDPDIGYKLMASANQRSDNIPSLLAAAYPGIIDGYFIDEETFVVPDEVVFRSRIMQYGWALSQDNAFYLVAGGLATMGLSYLNLSPDYLEMLNNFAEYGLSEAMSLCAPDFEKELKATIGWVNGKLSSHKISW